MFGRPFGRPDRSPARPLCPSQSPHTYGVECLLRRGTARALPRDGPLRLADGFRRLVVGPGVFGDQEPPCSCLIDSQKARVMDELSKPKSSAMALTTCFVESPVLMVADVGSIAVPCDQGDAYSTMSYIRALTSNGATARCEASFPVPACLSSKRETPARLSQAGVSWVTGNGSCCGSAPCCRWCFGIYLHAAAANR